MHLYLLPILVNEREIEPTVIKKQTSSSHSIQWCSTSGYFEFFRWRNRSWFVPESIQNIGNKKFLPLRMVWSAWRNIIQNLSHMMPFTVDCLTLTLLKPNPLTMLAEKSGLTTELALIILKLSNHHVLELKCIIICNRYETRNEWAPSKTVSRHVNNQGNVLTLGAMQKMMGLHHDKDVHMLKVACKLPNLTINCLHNSLEEKFYPFMEANKEMLEKIRDNIVGGPSILLTRKPVVDKTFNRISKNLCKSIVAIGASQL